MVGDNTATPRESGFCALHQVQVGVTKEIEDRVQRLVNEWHANNVALKGLEGEIHTLNGRVPIDLPQQLITLALKHDALHRDFTMLRTQVYSLIGTIIFSAIAAVTTWLMQGRLK